MLHGAPSAGHFEEARSMAALMRMPMYWFQHRQRMRQYCCICDDCLRCKPAQRRAQAPMNSFVVGEPLERMAIDITGPFPESRTGNRFVAVVLDYFTKWVEFIAMPNHTAETVAKGLVSQVFTRIGVPRFLHSDQGTDFLCKLFLETCIRFGIKKRPGQHLGNPRATGWSST